MLESTRNKRIGNSRVLSKNADFTLPFAIITADLQAAGA
jgi:hypothetical protein